MTYVILLLAGRVTHFIPSFTGISSSLMSLAQYVSSSTSGAMSDSLGRKPILLTLHVGLHFLTVVAAFAIHSSRLLNADSGCHFLPALVSLRCLFHLVRAGSHSERHITCQCRRAFGYGFGRLWSWDTNPWYGGRRCCIPIAYLVGPPASAWLLGRLFFNPEAGVSVLEPHIGLIAASLAVLDYICLFSFPETASVPDKNRGDAKVKKEVSPSTPTKSALEGIAGWNLLFFELEKCRSLVVNRALGIAVPTGNTSLERLPATFSHTLILSDVIYKFANAWLQYFVLKGLLIINHLICCLNPPECFKSIILAVAETAQSPGTLPFPKHCRQNWYVQMSCNCSFFTTVASGLVMFFQSAPLF